MGEPENDTVRIDTAEELTVSRQMTSDQCWMHSKTSGTVKLTLLAVARLCGGHVFLRVPISELGQMTGLSASTLKTNLRILEQIGEIEIRHGGGRGRVNRYRVA